MRLAALASVADQTPEGKSIVAAYAQAREVQAPPQRRTEAEFVAFTAQSRMSGIDLPDGVADPQRRAGRHRSLRRDA